jgi:hypothetical protein
MGPLRSSVVRNSTASLPSIGSVGDYDAMAEPLNGTFKAELVTLYGPWKTRRQLEIAIIEWIDWYNASWLHREIGDIPPFEHEAHWYLQNTPAVVAGPQIRSARIPGWLRGALRSGVTQSRGSWHQPTTERRVRSAGDLVSLSSRWEFDRG